MTIIHISDTHGFHRYLRELPYADIVIHSGDFTMNGSEAEAIDFLNWFCELPHRHKIFICGNHDECLYGAKIDGLDNNVHYLCNSGVTIDAIKFYGVPMFMPDYNADRLWKRYADIPANTDVLITHCPPFGILDCDNEINYGSEELLVRLSDLDLKAHLFGHIHAHHGLTTINNTIFSNAALLNVDYSIFNSPNVLDLYRGNDITTVPVM